MRIISLADIAHTGVSHNPEIRKQIMIANGEIEHITYFSRAVFPPGECAPVHHHNDMTEVFFIQSGSGQIIINDKLIDLKPGDCITVTPGETHELRNTGNDQLEIIYFGIQG